jgi:hypothetical protein
VLLFHWQGWGREREKRREGKGRRGEERRDKIKEFSFGCPHIMKFCVHSKLCSLLFSL